MKAVLIGDVHLSDRAPSIRKETYHQEILDKLAFAVKTAKTRGVDAIILAGDLFHIKTPSRTSHRLVQATHKVLTSAGIPVIVVPGNHDLQHDRLDSLDSQPLGALGRMHGVEILIGAHPIFPVFGLPYLADWSALPTWMSQYKEWADGVKAEDISTFPLMVTHAPIFPDGEDPPYDYIPASEWAELMEAGACYWGHIHDPAGVLQPLGLNTPVIMCNNGAISRGSLHEKTLKRKPVITVFDTEKPGLEIFETVEVPHLPIEQVFSMNIKDEADAQQARMTEFLDGLGSGTVEMQSMEQVHADLETQGLSESTLATARELVEWAISEG